jgi:Family of unknown function (DUF5996)
MVNHWWQVPLYVSARGLTTSLMHAKGVDLEVEFDFVDHVLVIRTSLPCSKGLRGLGGSTSRGLLRRWPRQFILPYTAVRTAADPDAMLLSFLQSTDDAAAELGAWDRASLDMSREP